MQLPLQWMEQISNPLPGAAVRHEVSSLLGVSLFPKEREQ